MRSEAGVAEDGKPSLTPAALGEMWPQVRPGLCRALLRSGAGKDAVDDAVAEAVTRALDRRLSVASPEDLSRWLFVVARNLLADGSRRERRLVSVPEVPEPGDPYDLALHVEQRQRLRATASAFAGLSVADQVAIRSAIVPSADCTISESPGATAVRRHRARSRLRGVAGTPIVLVVRVRSSSWWESPALRNSLAASVAAPLLMATAMLMAPPEHHDRPVASITMATATPTAMHEKDPRITPEVTKRAVVATPRNAPRSSPPSTTGATPTARKGGLVLLRDQEVERRSKITIRATLPIDARLPNVGVPSL